MKTLVITGTILTLASGLSYASLLASMMSEAFVLVLWGGVLLATARAVGVRPSSDKTVRSHSSTRDIRPSTIRLQADA
jgi:hypothetical protein